MIQIFRKGSRQEVKSFNIPSPIPLLKDSCQTISLEDLIVCMVELDLSPLGEGTQEARQEAYNKIRTQFAILTDERGYLDMWKLYADLKYLKAKIHVIEMCLEHMGTVYLTQFGELLAEYNFKYEWIYGTSEYNQQLQAVDTSYKQFIVERDLKQIRWDKMEADSHKSPPTREYFETELLTLSEDKGYHMKTTDVTAYQFTVMQKAYKKKYSKKRQR